jgi:hypothetical protein
MQGLSQIGTNAFGTARQIAPILVAIPPHKTTAFIRNPPDEFQQGA